MNVPGVGFRVSCCEKIAGLDVSDTHDCLWARKKRKTYVVLLSPRPRMIEYAVEMDGDGARLCKTRK